VPQKEQAGHGQRLRLDRVRESFTRSPQESTRRASRELKMFHVTFWLSLLKTSNEDSALIPWPPKSPDLTPCDFFFWGYVKDKLCVPPLPRDLPEHRQRIVAAVDTIDVNMLQRVWKELDYRIDVCRVIRGRNMEYL
jgi:hypothetical protein